MSAGKGSNVCRADAHGCVRHLLGAYLVLHCWQPRMETEGLPGRHPGCAAACATLPTLHAHALVLRSWVGNLWSGVQRTAIRRAFEWCALCPALACFHASAAPCNALLRMLFPPLAPRCMRALGPPAMHASPGISALPIALLFSMSPLPPFCIPILSSQFWQGSEYCSAVGSWWLQAALCLCGAARVGGRVGTGGARRPDGWAPGGKGRRGAASEGQLAV